MIYSVLNKSKNSLISQKAKMADSFFLRLLGLMFRKSIGKNEALIFKSAPSIHTFFMRFPIDIVFLDKNMKVIRICENLSPWRAVFCFGSAFTVELPPHRVLERPLNIGDILQITPI